MAAATEVASTTATVTFNALMVELVDTTDLKSVARMGVRVQVPPGV